jgi:hypothetical protein
MPLILALFSYDHILRTLKLSNPKIQQIVIFAQELDM